MVVRGGVISEQAFLSIADDGPGIPEGQQETVLARGERLDPSRSGSGLGLAIVRDMADSHGCSFLLETAEIGGLKTRLTWPDPASM